jgi:hypothetical protein
MCRAPCAAVMAKVADEDPWFGIEQEYYIMDPVTKWPLGWSGYFDPQKHDIQHAAVELTKQEASCHTCFKRMHPAKFHNEGLCMQSHFAAICIACNGF